MMIRTSHEALRDADAHFQAAVADLLELPELHASRERVHHFDLSEYDHLMGVARTAHQVSRMLRADPRVSARAGLLHDLGAHWFNTVKPVALATRLGECDGVRHAIRAHTVLPAVPRTREAWAVVAADFITTARECHFVYRRFRANRSVTASVGNLKRRLALQSRLSPFKGLRAGPYIKSATLSLDGAAGN
ncbi:MAG TPA: HD domain-containing protein [Chloroflexota bacterium]|nr:HD domain-containing protein [Chloroflexota bacterium]